MDIFKTDIFKTICGDMLVDNPVVMTIHGVGTEDISGPGGTSKKTVLYFEKTSKPLILNVTNSKKLAKGLGRETNNWRGAKVKLYAEEIKVKNELVNAVRLTVVEKPPVLTPAEHKTRLKQNGNMLHGNSDDGAIGEDADADRFADEVMNHIPFYTSRSQVFMALAGLEMRYSEETKELCLDALAGLARQSVPA